MQIFPNLSVESIPRTRDFFQGLGFSFNQQFSGEDALCLIINDQCSIMLLSRSHFQSFTSKEIINPQSEIQCMLALFVKSKVEVDSLMGKAIQLGATETQKKIDLGFMYSRGFSDLDGHVWEIGWYDPSEIQS
jgi:predicted lactoylglutathione lyase